MSATIGAALKKIAVALLTDKKVIKTIGGIIIGIIIIVVMPIIAVVSIFNGSMDIDTDKLNQSILENISAEQMENLQLISDTMTEFVIVLFKIIIPHINKIVYQKTIHRQGIILLNS